MAVLKGYSGSVKLTTNTVAELDKWSLDPKRNMGESGSFGDEWDEKTPLTGSWTAKASGRLDMTDTNGQVAIRTAFLNGTSVALRLYDAAATYWSGTAFISDFSINAARDGMVEVDFTFEGSGALSYT